MSTITEIEKPTHIKLTLMITAHIDQDNYEPRSLCRCNRAARWVKGGNIASVRALSVTAFNALICLDDVKLLLNSTFGLSLRAERIFDRRDIEKNVKKFCGELLDRCTPNHWKTTLRRAHACMNTRWAVASSLFSIRKCLASKAPSVRTYVKGMCEPSPPLDPGFAMFASAEIGRMFKRGWDKGYWNAVENFTPPTKSNLDKWKEGTYRERAVSGELNRQRFKRWSGGTVTEPIPRRVRAMAVETGGKKWRVITLSHPLLANLLPLHKTLYQYLTKEKWLLRGEAKPSSFEDFGKEQGEVFVSGDYESATDNINVNATELVLRRILSLATHIPTRVREEAMASLRLNFETLRGKPLGESARGQLMGSPLSFPLLCLINYLTFRYAVQREVPLKINGDDIVFRATPCEARRWFALVAASGLVVSMGKTLVSRSFFSLNSTYFRAQDSGARLVPHFRASLTMKRCEDMGALTGRVAQIRRDLGGSRGLMYKSIEILLRKNISMIYTAQGSFGRRFNCILPSVVLTRLGLRDRESFYLGLPFEAEPLERYTGIRQNVVPREWKKSGVSLNRGPVISDDIVRREMVSGSWVCPILRETRDEWWKRCRVDTYRYVPFLKKTLHLYSKLAPSLGLRAHYRPPISYPEQKEKKWCDNSVIKGPLGPVAFEFGALLSGTIRVEDG